MELDIQADEAFTNVFLYVSDALRYDAVPDCLRDRAAVVRTISSGLATPESMTTLVSGRYPPQHGIWQFSSRLADDVFTVFDLLPNAHHDFDHNGHILRDVLGAPGGHCESIPDLEEPFVYLVKDNYPHAPYGISLADENPAVDSFEEYWSRYGTDPERVRSDYHRGARKSGERFLRMVETLEDENLLEETFVVFTADHGELLGEYGLVDHGMHTCRELVEVPTMFFNESVTVDGDFIGHVDVLPTIASAIGESIPGARRLPGRDLFAGADDGRMILNQVRRSRFRETSTWDEGGAHVFSADQLTQRLRLAMEYLRVRATAKRNRRNVVSLVRTLAKRDRTIDTPLHTRSEAESFVDEVERTGFETAGRHLDQATVERLEQLGYREGSEI